ncbi:RND transporter [Bythopirellula goksoeyrii]|uniref:RND transporter n=1 Tax=Bythopirellula goksoeyrii TaxID=1400387 RepID=A0A5B9QPI7_9BACT|nr:RND transporter [Bythopirellula goksoeyrii]QEG35893.1 hypothetical protein Pr1d_31990 [Bythopirellula goksoeyrii]
MNWMLRRPSLLFGLLSLSVIALSGCGKSETASDGTARSHAVTNVDNSHGGWWCVEHGVPEEDCALCDKSLVVKFKEAGDWCEEHKRPESQCFICSPKRFDKFAATYEAKTGHKPPQPE